MFCSEWLKDAKFKCLVANDRTESFSVSVAELTLTVTAILTMALTMNLQ